MTVSIADFGASFEHYLPGVVETLNNTITAMKVCKGQTKEWQGSKLSKHLHVARSSALTWGVDGGPIPPSRKQNYVKAATYRKVAYGHVGLTDGIMKVAATSEHAATSVIESELKRMMEGVRVFYNFFWTRDGTGIVALLGATTSGATITVNDARAMWDQGDFTLLDTDGVTEHTTFRVSSTARAWNSTLNTATVTPTATIAAGAQAANDYIVWGTGQYSSYNRAITGLDAGIDDASGTFQEVSTSTYPRWTSPTLTNGGTLRQLTPALFRRMFAMLKQESDQDAELVIVGCYPLLSEMDKLYESAIRITPDASKVGLKNPTFQSALGTATIIGDQHAPYRKLFFVDTNEVTFAKPPGGELAWRPVSGEGSGIFLRSDQFAGYSATCEEFSELFYEARNKCGKIEDLAHDIDTAY